MWDFIGIVLDPVPPLPTCSLRLDPIKSPTVLRHRGAPTGLAPAAELGFASCNLDKTGPKWQHGVKMKARLQKKVADLVHLGQLFLA